MKNRTRLLAALSMLTLLAASIHALPTSLEAQNQEKAEAPRKEAAAITDEKNAEAKVALPAGKAISASETSSLFLRDDGTVWAVGGNGTGVLGDGMMFQRDTPVPVMADVAAISAGRRHSLFLKNDGSVWSVGRDSYGQLGDGYEGPFTRVTPVRVMTDVAAISAGGYHSLFLKKDGTAWAAGWNDAGQLGDGTEATRSKPVQVMTEVAAISAGLVHSLFLKNDGSVWAAGERDYGRLGAGKTAPSNTPVRVMTDAAAISAGLRHSLFLKNDGSAWATGWNEYGQLGDGTKATRSGPVQVMTQVAAISAGGYHSLFLKKDGTVWATGENRYGQLGDGTYTYRKSPLRVMTDVAALSAGKGHSLFIRKNGSIWAVGENCYGQLGIGDQLDRNTPTDDVLFRKPRQSDIQAEKEVFEKLVKSGFFRKILTKPALPDPPEAQQPGQAARESDEAPKPILETLDALGGTAEARDVFGILAISLKSSGLHATLQEDGPFTLFAVPGTEYIGMGLERFTHLLGALNEGEDMDFVVDLTANHIVKGEIRLEGLEDAQEVTAMSKRKLALTRKGKEIFVNDVKVLQADIRCTNGVIHIIGAPLIPIDNIVRTMETTRRFNTLVAAIKAAGLAETLANKPAHTLIAPTDEAFEKLPNGVIEMLLEPGNKNLLLDILSHHVVQGTVPAETIRAQEQLDPLNGKKLTIQPGKKDLVLNGAKVSKSDILCTNGMIHEIDTVLISPDRQKELDEWVIADRREGVGNANKRRKELIQQELADLRAKLSLHSIPPTKDGIRACLRQMNDPERRLTISEVFRTVACLEIRGLTEDILLAADQFKNDKRVTRLAGQAMRATVTPDDLPFLVAQINPETPPNLQVLATHTLRSLADSASGDRLEAWALNGDLDATARLSAALALGDRGDRRALSALLGLMTGAETFPVRGRAELALRTLTGQSLPFSAYGKPALRNEQAAAWHEWIAGPGATAELRSPIPHITAQDSLLNGRTLIALASEGEGTNGVILYDEAMKEVWSYECKNPLSAEFVDNGNILIAERNRAIEVTPEKEIIREYKGRELESARYLASGNLLVTSWTDGALEIDTENKVVWTLGARFFGDAIRLDNGNTLVADSTYNAPVVTEFDANQKPVWRYEPPRASTIDGIQLLESGNVLIFFVSGDIIEVDKKTKKAVWELNDVGACGAFRQENGHTLVITKRRLFEVDPAGKEIWTRELRSNVGSIRR